VERPERLSSGMLKDEQFAHGVATEGSNDYLARKSARQARMRRNTLAETRRRRDQIREEIDFLSYLRVSASLREYLLTLFLADLADEACLACLARACLLSNQVLLEEIDRALPRELRRGFIVSRGRVVVEA